MLQGNIDLSFRLKGHKGSGTLYFTSVRKAKGEPFTIRKSATTPSRVFLPTLRLQYRYIRF